MSSPVHEDEHQRLMRTKILPFCTGMARLLTLMVGPVGREHWKRDGPWLCRCDFPHPDFELRVVCRDKRIRPFLAYIERPCRHSAYLGRLMPDGTVHVFDQGLKVFFNQLWEEGVLDAFLTALQATVTHYQSLDPIPGKTGEVHRAAPDETAAGQSPGFIH